MTPGLRAFESGTMTDLIKVRARPKLNSPNLVAAWPGIADVAAIAAIYLKRKLKFRPLGEIDAPAFFDPIGVTVRNNVVEEPHFPQSQFYYWKNQPGKNDLILFVGDEQPTVKRYELANCVLEMGLRFGIRRVYTCAAAITRIHHTESPKVWGVATNRRLTAELGRWDLLRRRGDLRIGGLNGLLLGVAKERGVDAFCILGEVPAAATRIPNPMAALAILRVLAQVLDIKLDYAELEEVAAQAKEHLKEIAAQAMGEYIDLFTEPIWEQGEEEQ